MTDADLLLTLGRLTGSVEALHKRFDEYLVRENESDRASSAVHASFEQRLDGIERWQSKVVGVAIGIGLGSGLLGGSVGALIVRLAMEATT